MNKSKNEYNIIKLSDDIKYWRAERPDEWVMDRFIKTSEQLESDNSQLIELLKKIDKDVLLPYEHSYYKNRIKELIK